MEKRRDVFHAISDPTRRSIIGLLARRPLTLNEVVENFKVSRPTISKHIKVLTECGVIKIRKAGRLRYCDVQLRKLEEVILWTEQYRVFWSEKLDALEDFLDEEN